MSPIFKLKLKLKSALNPGSKNLTPEFFVVQE